MSVESVMPPDHLILCHSLLLLPSIFPSISGRSREFLKSNLLGGGRYREKLFLGGQNCPIRPLWAEGSGRFQLNWMRVLVRRVQAARSWLRPVCRPHDWPWAAGWTLRAPPSLVGGGGGGWASTPTKGPWAQSGESWAPALHPSSAVLGSPRCPLGLPLPTVGCFHSLPCPQGLWSWCAADAQASSEPPGSPWEKGKGFCWRRQWASCR